MAFEQVEPQTFATRLWFNINLTRILLGPSTTYPLARYVDLRQARCGHGEPLPAPPGGNRDTKYARIPSGHVLAFYPHPHANIILTGFVPDPL